MENPVMNTDQEQLPHSQENRVTDDQPIQGELALQTIAMPKDTNASGDIFGGWLVSQMDLAAGIMSGQLYPGRVVTVAIEKVTFLKPVRVGSTVSCYCRVIRKGRTSLHIAVEVWTSQWRTHGGRGGCIRVAEGLFVFVAIDSEGRPCPLPD